MPFMLNDSFEKGSTSNDSVKVGNNKSFKRKIETQESSLRKSKRLKNVS